MKEIPVKGGLVALVDDEDYGRLAMLAWRSDTQQAVTYALTNLPRDGGKRKSPRMHQLVLPSKPGFRVDHKDGNGLNNHRSNLRYATQGQQKQNSVKRAVSTSRFKGVCLQGKYWRAQVKVHGVVVFSATSKSEEDAATMYNFAAFEAHGEFFRGNA